MNLTNVNSNTRISAQEQYTDKELVWLYNWFLSRGKRY